VKYLLGKFVFFIASCTLRIAVEAEGVIRLTGRWPPDRQPSWTTGDGLGIFEELIDFCGVTATVTVLIEINFNKAQNGGISLKKIIIMCE
jgi:hypothetical protein